MHPLGKGLAAVNRPSTSWQLKHTGSALHRPSSALGDPGPPTLSTVVFSIPAFIFWFVAWGSPGGRVDQVRVPFCQESRHFPGTMPSVFTCTPTSHQSDPGHMAIPGLQGVLGNRKKECAYWLASVMVQFSEAWHIAAPSKIWFLLARKKGERRWPQLCILHRSRIHHTTHR